MPFAMTHLYIAYNILSNTPQINKPYDFLLGALAPDSVHFRDNYNSDMKKKSHLCVGNEKWGRIYFCGIQVHKRSFIQKRVTICPVNRFTIFILRSKT